MRINRIETKAYVISADAEKQALEHFKKKAAEVEKNSNSKVTTQISHHYVPLMVVSGVKYDKQGRGLLIEGLENTFHIGLTDACFYVLHHKTMSESAKDAFMKSGVDVERIDRLLDISTLSYSALKTLGFLLDNGTMYWDKLDVPTQQAVKELNGRKYADIWRGVDRESEVVSALREVFSMESVTPLTKVKPTVDLPRFTHTSYNLSPKLLLTEYVEEELELEKIVHAPDKINYILGILFNCRLVVNRIVYLPYVKCTFQWLGKQSTEIKYIPCPKHAEPIKYKSPKKLKTITIGTKGHGLEAIPFEDVAINFSNVAGMHAVKEKLKEGIIYPIAHPELSKKFGTKGGGGVLMYGPPGCGKSYIMRATVGEAGVDFFSISTQDIIGDDIDAAAKRIDDIFSEARASSPAILFFDEIDALGGSRKSGQSGSEHRLVNQFLQNMDGVGASNENVMVIGSTNAPWDMDPALRRAGRFTTQILIPPPDNEARIGMIKTHIKGRPLAQDINIERLAELTDNYSSADVTAICDEAAKIPWRESIHGQEGRPIQMLDFQKALEERESSLLPWLRLAEKQLRESGESDIFPELADYVFKRAGGIEMASAPTIKFADVGGLDDVKEEIKNKIVYPMQHPELTKEYGREAGGALLLYGPPGCGKTYIAKATAGECSANFFNVKITDLLSPEEGVTEKRLHAIFERASRNTPAIIFFDEIDAVAGQRTSAEGGAERRLINQFLVEMDGFEKTEGVTV
ncbi:MAG: AAA family ATPase, partial [Candidatus Altiarchaeota archaeon]|nr:AAA family ATPase [Candidatus Altiarchaeota archaeon]